MFVETPRWLAARMVERLFEGRPPSAGSRVLDAGCGRGVFLRAVLDWVSARGLPVPELVCVELDVGLAEEARRRLGPAARVVVGDFLEMEGLGFFDYVISNPPYVRYEEIDRSVRERLRGRFVAAVGRFDLYMVFMERGLEVLRPGGRAVFVTPEKYMYVLSGVGLRRLLERYRVEVELVDEGAFGGVLAYPAVTVVDKVPGSGPIRVVLRDGSVVYVERRGGASWLWRGVSSGPRLGDVALRVSAGVATGRDDVFVLPRWAVPRGLEGFVYPTVGGAELSRFKPGEALEPRRLTHVMVVPYGRDGRLLPEDSPVVRFLARWRRVLEERYAVKVEGKPWYAFHEDPPMDMLLRPKILWRDIAKEPAFYADLEGSIVPRHSVYYLVPRDPSAIPELLEFLNSERAREWIRAHVQRAANGYLRLQSHVLKMLPLEVWR